MSDLQAKVPGKGRATANGVSAAGPIVGPAIGKSTLAGLVPDYVTGGAHCEQPGAGGASCTMSQHERGMLINTIGSRVNRALAVYLDVTTELRIAELAKTDEAKMPWFFELLLAVLPDVADETVKLAIREIHAGGKNYLSKLTKELVGSSTWANTGLAAIEAVSPDEMHKHLKHVVDLKKLTKVAPHKTPQVEGAAFIAALQDNATVAFQAIAEESPTFMSDGELFVLCAALNSHFHKPSVYRDAITKKLARFEKSGVKEIGGMAQVTRDNAPPTGNRSSDAAWQPTSTKMEWSGYDGPTDMTGPGSPGRSGAGSVEHRVERKVVYVRYGSGMVPDHYGYTVKGTYTEPVPKEFETYAVTRHLGVFGEEPAVHLELEHENPARYISEPWRIKASYDNLQRAKGSVLPTLRLGAR